MNPDHRREITHHFRKICGIYLKLIRTSQFISPDSDLKWYASSQMECQCTGVRANMTSKLRAVRKDLKIENQVEYKANTRKGQHDFKFERVLLIVSEGFFKAHLPISMPSVHEK